MKIKELIIESTASKTVKPRNFVAKNAVKTTSGAGAHRDKKKEQKQGYEKHKGKEVAEATKVQESHVADVTLDTGERKRIRYLPTKKDLVDTIVRYYLKQGLKVIKVNNTEVEWKPGATTNSDNKNEEAAGVGIVTKQNATVDVPVGGEYMNVKKLFPKKKKSVSENSNSEELANNVYAEFERMYPRLARRADERTVHDAIMDVLNYGDDSNPSALAQDVARAVKRNTQSVDESFKNTYNVGDRVDSPLGTGTVVAVSKNINVDGRVKVKLDDSSKAGEDGKYKDSFVLTTDQLTHISNENQSYRKQRIKEALKDKDLAALQRVKQEIEKEKASDMDAWEKDFRQNYAPKFAHLKKPEKEIPDISSIGLEKPKPEKKEPEARKFQGTSQELTSRANFIFSVVEKLKNLDKLKEKADKLGILTKTLASETDMELYIKDAKEKDEYKLLNQKVDDSIEKIQERIRVHRIAYSAPRRR
jgi:biopolymer transport protein ExbD